MCYENNDQQHITKKLLPARLRSFFNMKEEEKLQDYNMVRRSAVSKTKHKLRICYAKLSFYFMFLNIRRFPNVFFLFCILQFLLPCSLCGFEQDETISHYFTITVNMQKQRFELLDSSTAYPGTIEFFHNVTSKLMKIWKHVSTELQLSQKSIDHFKRVKLQVPLQGEDT